ncbi:glycoside hydrolase family 127 protein [Herbidospora daliensis]|uniref:glycoside hydrolase family 127 protein n=1 Tax=Herbidospora daliensis TaxID=295585 RepID=UPI000A92EB1D|nr:beta-L-arabinofuranosidase domain-containing protein [Herbidospora daliensis]
MIGPVLPSSGVSTPLGLDAVRPAPGFWGDRIGLNREVTLAHCRERMEREGWIANFRGELPRRGRESSDAEVYKLLEGLAWADHPALPELAGVVARAQEADGYLNTRWKHARYTDFEWGCELYCHGHLIQAGIARLRTHGEDELTQVARRAADHVCDRFMDTAETCGHPVVETALVELYRATGVERYLEMARRFVERRGLPALGDVEFGRGHFQDDVPVRRASVFRGHAVRALYLACGVVDVAVETGDAGLLEAVEAQWAATVARRTHLTGGMGSRHFGESFGEDFELPPDRAHAETCAGIASFMLAHRLLLATGDVRHADLAERTLYNVLATSPAPDGESFFAANPLQARTPAERAPWSAAACCPGNLARTFAALPAYLAAADGAGVRIHHHTPAEIRHAGLVLKVETGYPWSGRVAVTVAERGTGPIALRVPSWAVGATLSYGETRRVVAPGYAVAEVDGGWRPGDVITLDLPVVSRWTVPDARIDALRGSVAVERGPLVYCAESAGDDPPLARVVVRPDAAVEHVVDGAVELDVKAALISGAPTGWPYTAEMETPDEEPITLRLVAYHRWGEHGPATMRVWLPVDTARSRYLEEV